MYESKTYRKINKSKTFKNFYETVEAIQFDDNFIYPVSDFCNRFCAIKEGYFVNDIKINNGDFIVRIDSGKPYFIWKVIPEKVFKKIYIETTWDFGRDKKISDRIAAGYYKDN